MFNDVLKKIGSFLFVLLQYCLPQHFISRCVGKLADCEWFWVKQVMIRLVQRSYDIDLSEFEGDSADDFRSFNAFFIRPLLPGVRSMCGEGGVCVSPCDGRVLSVAPVSSEGRFMIKRHSYRLEALLAGAERCFSSVSALHSVVIYLAPSNYHRVHMPLNGRLIAMTYVPGKLFSVNGVTSDSIPDLFARNERLVCQFETDWGPMVVVLVGAMIVGSMAVSWEGVVKPVSDLPQVFDYAGRVIELEKGGELGYFRMGSTVAVFLGEAAVAEQVAAGRAIRLGEPVFVRQG